MAAVPADRVRRVAERCYLRHPHVCAIDFHGRRLRDEVWLASLERGRGRQGQTELEARLLTRATVLTSAA